MDPSSQQALRLVLLRLLNRCRDARARVQDGEAAAWLATVEFHAWHCWERYRDADEAQCSRLLMSCEQILERMEHLAELAPPVECRSAA